MSYLALIHQKPAKKYLVTSRKKDKIGNTHTQTHIYYIYKYIGDINNVQLSFK